MALVVALCGVDGSGKTTLANDLKNELSHYCDVEVASLFRAGGERYSVSMRFQNMRVIRAFVKILRQNSNSWIRELVFWIRLFSATVDPLLTKMSVKKRKSRIVILERSAVDVFVNLCADYSRTWPIRLLNVLNLYGFTIGFDIPLDTLLDRRPEHDEEYFLVRMDLYSRCEVSFLVTPDFTNEATIKEILKCIDMPSLRNV